MFFTVWAVRSLVYWIHQ